MVSFKTVAVGLLGRIGTFRAYLLKTDKRDCKLVRIPVSVEVGPCAPISCMRFPFFEVQALRNNVCVKSEGLHPDAPWWAILFLSHVITASFSKDRPQLIQPGVSIILKNDEIRLSIQSNPSLSPFTTVSSETDVNNWLFRDSCVGAARKVSPNWSLKTMTCHSSHCFSIVWGSGKRTIGDFSS